ncbi:MAG: hypothetical protein M3004_06500, partial [Bacteroidota bacterium]|nr:hypothetical protein [Bacteroidota bacterium]
APIYNNYTDAATSDINLTGLTKGIYYFKLFTYYGDRFSAYAITPFFTSSYVTATISLLNATQGTGCNTSSLTYKLGGSTSPYTPYTVKLYKNNIFYDSVIVDKDTVTFKFLPEGSYYAIVRGFGAPATITATSTTSQFLPVTPSPVPTVAPVITKSGRMLISSSHAARETYQWYRDGALISGATDSNYYAALRGSYTARFANACGAGSVSNTITFTGDYQTQTITFSPIPDKTFGDSIVTLNATASSGLPVEFILISGKAQITGNRLIIKGAGTITVEARQQGDDNYGIAPPVRQTFTVLKAPQSLTFADIADKDYKSQPFTLSATSSSGLPVAYSVISGNASVSENTVTLTGIGTVTIRASQPGDSNYLAANAVEKSFCVTVTKLNPMKGPSGICPGKPATYTAENIAGGVYTWRISGGSTLSSTTNSVTVTWPSAGTYTLIVNASGNCGAPSKNDSLIVTAVSSLQPDSVKNMLPENGAVNQQLPLTLSWIPAHPELYYTYDVYLWRANQAQPSTPYAANLTTVNYTIPLNSGLVYNTAYKWMVVAHNGSCADINTGPVQQFSLIPLPDLQVYNVTAPTSAFSGQTISVTWKVKNNGPGNTQLNQRWTDAVFISKDSILDFTNPVNQLTFPIVPKLVATKANVSALNSGEFYNDTATFILPIDYSGTLYMHVITNYAPPASNPVLETTLVNDTAHALPATIVALTPQPDLRVDTIVNPNNTFSGSTINVTYRVKNYGATANGSWNDKIYISKDALFNINNAVLLKYPNSVFNGYDRSEIYYPANDAIIGFSGILQEDSAYTRTVSVVVPNFIYGSYYIYVFTDADKQLYEGPNEDNNVDHGNLLQVFLTATPKVVPINVSVPSNVGNTQTVLVGWKDQNQGAYDNIHKSKGHYYVQRGFCEIPCMVICDKCVCYPTPGTTFIDSLGFGSSYWIDKVYLSTDSTGLDFGSATLLGEAPQGSPYFSSPDGIQESKCLPGRNYGNSFNSLNPSNFNINTSSALLPNQQYPSAFNYKIPDNIPQGKYYIYVYSNANKTVYEYPGTPQIARSNAFTVAWADLTVPTVTVPSSGNSGQSITVGYTLLNVGQGVVENHYRKDYIYLGNNSTFDGTAVIIDSVIYNSASV